jgi:serine protease
MAPTTGEASTVNSTSLIPRPVAALLGAVALMVAVFATNPNIARGATYVPGEVVVQYAPGPVSAVAADAATRIGARVAAPALPGTQVLRLPRGVSVAQAITRLRRQRGVVDAVPNYVAHIAAGPFVPDDPGRGGTPGGWESLQWNFLAPSGVDAPDAWANLIADHRPGGRGVVVAILDTGVAYRNWHQFRESPDFIGTRFTHPCDLVAGTIKRGKCTNQFPLDREGHGTFVAGVVAEATNNGIGLTGIAYGATIMPVRVLDADGTGDAQTISEGIRYAATHGANVINLSLEFDMSISASDIPDIISAIRFAHRHGVIVVAAAGNDAASQVAYPARVPAVISVGATTRDRCLADYSNLGPGMTLVAPGGGDDSSLPGDPNCHPDRNLPNVFQMTFSNPAKPGKFGYPGDWYGTSMSSPHVAAIAALVIASGVLGHDPTPDQVLRRLEQTAEPLGGAKPNENYGYGLVNAAAATAPPVTLPPPPAAAPR